MSLAISGWEGVGGVRVGSQETYLRRSGVNPSRKRAPVSLGDEAPSSVVVDVVRPPAGIFPPPGRCLAVLLSSAWPLPGCPDYGLLFIESEEVESCISPRECCPLSGASCGAFPLRPSRPWGSKKLKEKAKEVPNFKALTGLVGAFLLPA